MYPSLLQMWTSVETVRSCATRMLVVSIWLDPTTVSVAHPSTETGSHVKVHLAVAYLLTLTYHTYFFLTNCLTSHVILLLTGTYHTYFVLMNCLTQSESIVLVPHCTGCVVIWEKIYTVKIYSFGIRAIKFRRVHFESKSYFIKKGIYSW